MSFETIPITPCGHFRLHFYAAIYRLIGHLHRLSEGGGLMFETTLRKFPFLDGYFREMLPFLPDDSSWTEAATWWETEICRWEKATDDILPISALSARLGLDFPARLALLLIGVAEEDARFATVIAALQSPLNYRQPCIQFLGQVLCDGQTDAWKLCHPLIRAGLVEVANRESPRSEWALRVEGVVWGALRGETDTALDGVGYYVPADSFRTVEDLILPTELRIRLRQIPELVRAAKLELLILRSAPGGETVSVSGAAAKALGCGLIVATAARERSPRHWNTLALLSIMTGAWPVIAFDLAPGETAELAWPNYFRGPAAVLLGLEGGLCGKALDKAVTLVVPNPSATERRRLWEETLQEQPVEELDRIVERFQLPGGHLRQVASMAIAQTAFQNREKLSLADVREACRSLNRESLDSLATPLDSGGTLDRLVAGAATADKLRELEHRCWLRETILTHLGAGFGARDNRGVRALFTGPSGTGKTLAAQILAGRLGIDLYRVDLAAVINKYVGETEKNLHRILSRAEALDVILLLDEGDALLGKRSDIKSANDRYANLETNYLLQKLEGYQGIVIVTTNAGDNIDKAFQRRMDVVAHFSAPLAEERLQIWLLHLPARQVVGDAFMEEVALRCSLTGGQIRNAAQHATMLALAEDGGVVGRWHLESAVQSEYRKAGAICPLSAPEPSLASHGGMAAFLDAL